MPWGMGRWGWVYPPPYGPYGYPYVGGFHGSQWWYGPNREQERRMLEEWGKDIEEWLKEVKARIAEIEKE